jgi:gentisate 1,2-dioxygenase
MNRSETPFYTKPETTEVRKEYYRRLDRKNAAPLWEVLAGLVTPQPQPRSEPAIWKYSELRPLLLEASGLITAKEAERRVVVLENPGIRGISQITGSLYAGVQLVMPGEIAPSHRHTASALRFVLESEGAYTAVDGERTTMEPGDFILTPSWTFHDHGNPGTAPAIWLDGLDVPIVNLFDTSFAGHFGGETQPVTRPEGYAESRFGANMIPMGWEPAGKNSPIFNYRYSKSREALARLAGGGDPDPVHGYKLEYVNPADGGPPMPTIGAFLQLLPSGFDGAGYRSTDATVISVVEGEGTTMIGDVLVSWSPRDIFVVPSWAPVRHRPARESVLFSFSDRPAQKALGLWREEHVA